MKIKVGFGFDVHQLQEGRDFFIGGVKIPHSKGALGHSDADALIHAICDALLGAAGLKDIGFYFPDTSAEFKGIDSKILLKRVVDLISEKGYIISNVDVSLVLEKPKINAYIDEMINNIKKDEKRQLSPQDKDLLNEAIEFMHSNKPSIKEGVMRVASIIICDFIER